ncbi:beta-ketoacyl-ACP synthase [Synechococcales cyanobacterium C]|uniref:Beta-ketoacyl-ACP synthase n=1 Tax=Petrachloros mirabilis ULC683 TaxID=2781853 RepID=A0A8K1ZYU4_9CYAN|nr:beta-ketoacyl-ACP synthase [Petrachloros mirabilis]NCJ06616.1 beta-ketoacyl-ACP synthase [Petrachloros mirabilis ULC683]
MTAIVVSGMGMVSALGTSPAQHWQQLLAQVSGIQIQQPFKEIPPLPLALVGAQPTSIYALLDQTLTATLADAQLIPPLGDCGVVIGSSRGAQAGWENLAAYSAEGQDLGMDFLQLYGQSPASWVAHHIHTQGPVLSPRAACATGLWAIAQGMALIQMGHCQQVLVGAVEAPVTPLTLAGFLKMGTLATTGAYPFDCDREGFVLGEGATFLLLEQPQSALARGAPIYGQLLGYGLTADGYHLSTPEQTRRWATAAVQDCLRRSGLTPETLDYIHPHGTATHLNDRAEAQLVQRIFPNSVALSTTKGATGHTLGASGTFGAAFCLLAIQHQLLPPCVGLRHPCAPLNFIRDPTPAPCEAALCLSFGFGGQNAALALGRWHPYQGQSS